MLEHGLCLKCARKKCYHPPHPYLGARARRRFIRTGPKREFMSQFPPLTGPINTTLFFQLQHREMMWLNHCTLESLRKWKATL